MNNYLHDNSNQQMQEYFKSHNEGGQAVSNVIKKKYDYQKYYIDRNAEEHKKQWALRNPLLVSNGQEIYYNQYANPIQFPQLDPNYKMNPILQENPQLNLKINPYIYNKYSREMEEEINYEGLEKQNQERYFPQQTTYQKKYWEEQKKLYNKINFPSKEIKLQTFELPVVPYHVEHFTEPYQQAEEMEGPRYQIAPQFEIEKENEIEYIDPSKLYNYIGDYIDNAKNDKRFKHNDKYDNLNTLKKKVKESIKKMNNNQKEFYEKSNIDNLIKNKLGYGKRRH